MFEDFFAHRGFEDEADFLPMLPFEDEEEADPDESYPEVLPVLALKNTVLFPNIVVPITVGRDRSIKAINKAYETNRFVAVLAQRDLNVEEPEATDLYQVGTIARVLKLLRMPDT